MKPANQTVAVVDDEDNLRETLAFALRREGYPVELFAHGAEAWSAFQRRLPGLVILDILMPEMDGLELCRRIRSISETIPIIFLTSRDEEFDRVLGLEIGADDYLGKPFSMRELLARVKVLFRRAALDASNVRRKVRRAHHPGLGHDRNGPAGDRGESRNAFQRADARRDGRVKRHGSVHRRNPDH